MINKEDSFKCSICKKEYSNQKYLDDDEEKENPDYGDVWECDFCDEEFLCGDCVYGPRDNDELSICLNCIKSAMKKLSIGTIEKVVEKVVEKPIYVKEGNVQLGNVREESMIEFEKRIVNL